jgi:uncharacterized protein (TIGR02246 family)
MRSYGSFSLNFGSLDMMGMRQGLLAVALSLAAISPAAALDSPAACTVATYPEITALFDRWNDSLKTLDPKLVDKNYARDAVLLPTLSGEVDQTPDDREKYFEYFLTNRPTGVIDMRVIKLGCNEAIDIGLYTFTYHDETGKETKTVPARYTYTYVWNGTTWLISTHHSSARPGK